MTHVFDADGHICEPPRVWEEYAAYAAAEATFVAVGHDVRDQIVGRNPRRFFGLAPF